jgi:steroid delta-isomerase-like uncharacterized protein
MTTEQNKAAERRIIEGLNKGDLAIVNELFAADYVYHGPASLGEIRGPEGFKQLMKMIYSGFPDFHMAIEDMVAEGEKVVTRATYSGTHKGEFVGIALTGKQVSFTGALIARFVDGKEAEAWEEFDMLSLLQQLGVIPPMGQPGK